MLGPGEPSRGEPSRGEPSRGEPSRGELGLACSARPVPALSRPPPPRLAPMRASPMLVRRASLAVAFTGACSPRPFPAPLTNPRSPRLFHRHPHQRSFATPLLWPSPVLARHAFSRAPHQCSVATAFPRHPHQRSVATPFPATRTTAAHSREFVCLTRSVRNWSTPPTLAVFADPLRTLHLPPTPAARTTPPTLTNPRQTPGIAALSMPKSHTPSATLGTNGPRKGYKRAIRGPLTVQV